MRSYQKRRLTSIRRIGLLIFDKKPIGRDERRIIRRLSCELRNKKKGKRHSNGRAGGGGAKTYKNQKNKFKPAPRLSV